MRVRGSKHIIGLAWRCALVYVCLFWTLLQVLAHQHMSSSASTKLQEPDHVVAFIATNIFPRWCHDCMRHIEQLRRFCCKLRSPCPLCTPNYGCSCLTCTCKRVHWWSWGPNHNHEVPWLMLRTAMRVYICWLTLLFYVILHRHVQTEHPQYGIAARPHYMVHKCWLPHKWVIRQIVGMTVTECLQAELYCDCSWHTWMCPITISTGLYRPLGWVLLR